MPSDRSRIKRPAINADIPPHSVEAEMCALGSAMLSKQAAKTLLSRLTSDHFFLPAHKVIYKAIWVCDMEDTTPDLVTVKDQLAYTDQIKDAAGIEYLINLNECVPTPKNISSYCQIVEDYWALRQIMYRCSDVYEMVKSSDLSVLDKLEAAKRITDGLIAGASQVTHVSEIVIPESEEAESLPWMIGGGALQRVTHGLYLGQITTIEFPTGHGKTMTALQTVKEQCKAGRSAIYVTLADLQPRHLKLRLLTMLTGLRAKPRGPEDDLYSKGKAASLEKWDRGVAEVNGWNLRIYNAAQLGGDATVEGILATLAKALESEHADVVVIDYAQKITSREKSESTVAAATSIAAKLGLFTGAYPKTAFLVLSQISKDGETSWAREWMNQAGVRIQGKLSEDSPKSSHSDAVIDWTCLKHRFWPVEGMGGQWTRSSITGLLSDVA